MARAQLARLIPQLAQPWLGRHLYDCVARLADRWGRTIPAWAPKALSIGESWLLLADSSGRGKTARMRVAAPDSKGPFLDRNQTLNAIRGLAAAANRRGYLVSVEWLSLLWELADGSGAERIEGGSLGLSTCVALLSHVSQQAPHTRVAGSAIVDPKTGALSGVQHLEPKLRALHADWPEVTHVVVAAEQVVPENAPVQVIRCEDIVEAITYFGLDVSSLPKPPIESLPAVVAGFEGQDAQLHTLSQWAALSAMALEVSELLRSRRPDESIRARIWAALFASHAADNVGAASILRAIDEVAIEEEHHRAMRAIVLATATIDDDPKAAAGLGEKAVLAASGLPASKKTQWLGRALGTHGRALMHAGVYAQAEPLLRQAYEHHAQKVPEEAARSACYLACCLRKADRAREALQVAELARHEAETGTGSHAARSTLPYAALEKSRALVALDRTEEAVLILGELVRTGEGPHQYPRLGAHRSLATAYRQLGRLAEAEDQLLHAWSVALGRHYATARKVGLVAAVEELEHATATGRRPLIDEETVAALWTELFGNASRSDVLATWIY